MNPKSSILKINPTDNIAVALDNLDKGHEVKLGNTSFKLNNEIAIKHKFACKDFKPKDAVYMYGVLVGEAIKHIPRGGLLTTENIKHKIQEVHGKTVSWEWTPPNKTKWHNQTFKGYHRADGQVGTDNIWLFFPSIL
jgi:altronate hydrolase